MNRWCCFCGVLILALHGSAEAARRSDGPLTPFRKSTTRGALTIDTVGDTLGQSSAQNTRLIIRVFGADQRPIKPVGVALIDKSGVAIKPVSREDRKAGNEENTGLPLTVGGYRNNAGYGGTGVGVDLNKLFGPRGSYAYTKADWPKQIFTSDKKLQIVLPGGQAFLLPLTSIAK